MVPIICKKQIDITNSYFHSFSFDEESFKDIIQQGIKCKLYQGYFGKEHSYNGSFYISLFKKSNNNSIIKSLECNPCIIVDSSINVFKASPNNPTLFANTPIPIRYSPYDNEYQKFLSISPDKFLGIGVNLQQLELKYRLQQLQQIISWLNSIDNGIDIIEVNKGFVIDKAKSREYIKKNL